MSFILQSVHLLYKYAIRIHFLINFSYYTNKLSWYPVAMYSRGRRQVGKLVKFKQKGQKQASFLAFHKCCQGCLLRGPRYFSTSFILVCALRCTQLQGTRKVYSQAEKFIRLVRIKETFIRIAYLYSKCTDCRIRYCI